MLTDHRLPSQQLLFPEVIELTADEMEIMREAMPDIEWFGFQLSQFSPDSYSIEGVPALLTNESVVPVLRHILSSISESGLSAKQQWHRRMALSLASDVAIPVGRDMSETEMKDLLVKLFMLKERNYTPDGKAVMKVMSIDEIKNKFV